MCIAHGSLIEQALWNLAYYEPNRCRMRDVGGVEVLKELAGTILEER